MPLIEITEKSHPVILDIRYASTNNFTKKIIYEEPLCLILDEALVLFEKAIVLAQKQNFTFKIFDAFRPQKAQERLWEICPNDMYIMPPSKGSVHTRGVAIDLTLVDADGTELDMGTPFDDFTEKSHHGTHISAEAERNRYMLLGIMTTAGFDFYRNEWWHYQMFSAQSFDLIRESYGIMKA
ncbi:MAG: D-alanyl-D-alanine dipeptidase [Candidatus Paracaedibacteraceae bacterium]|nr:D-alanyl-D-alanine dipeptidase [Candidatus Paracaedibacteraceae bacterium]